MIKHLLVIASVLTASTLVSQQPNSVRERPAAPWPPPTGQIRVIIDTDTANEIDDQWAIALALGFPERLKIEGFVAAHYGQRGGARGIEKSRASLEATLEAAGMKEKFPLRNGSDPIIYRDRLPQSEGVDFILAMARTATPTEPVWLILLGAPTDGAVALLKEPAIADRLVVFWHGRSSWPERCTNFNATNDPLAAQLLFELPCRLVLFDTGTDLTMPMRESEQRVGRKGALGKFLHEIRLGSAYASRDDKGIFDLGDIAALLNTNAITWEVTAAPSVRMDLSYDFAHPRGSIVRISRIDRDASFSLLDEALARLAR
jgi:purine nucleosidase